MGVAHRCGRVLRGAGVWLGLAAACACAQEDAPQVSRDERWLAMCAVMAEACGALSGKWEEASGAATTTPVESLVLPLNYHDKNQRVHTLLKAEKAHLLGEDFVFAWNVKVEMFLPDGKPDGVLTAEDCLLDRVNKRGFCRGAVDIQKGPDRLKGRGMFFSTEEDFIKLLSECEFRTFRIPASFGRLR